MKHRIYKKKISRKTNHRISLLRNLSKSLINCKRIKTTLAKAKELKKFIEKLITRAKKNSLHNRRIVISNLASNSKEISLLFQKISPKYCERHGGYVRIIKTGYRYGDSAPMALIEFI